MKIAICLKQVPTRDWQPRLDDSKTWIREQDATFEMNEPDAYALEEGLRLKEKHGGEVVVCSLGPSRVAQVLREPLARFTCSSMLPAVEETTTRSSWRRRLPMR